MKSTVFYSLRSESILQIEEKTTHKKFLSVLQEGSRRVQRNLELGKDKYIKAKKQ